MAIFPAFRLDLEIFPRTAGSKHAFFIKDPKTQRVFEVEEEEYFLCQELNGETPHSTIQARFEARFERPLPLKHIEAFIRQLESEGLLVGSSPRSQPTMVQRSWWRPEWKLKLLDSDWVFAWAVSHLNWAFTRPAKLFFASVIFLGLYELLWNCSDWLEATAVHAATSTLFRVVTALMFLNLLPLAHPMRNIIHGVVWKRHGGTVKSVDVYVYNYVYPVLVLPLEVFSQLPVRSKRCWAAFAAICAQLFLLAVGAIGWRITRDGSFANTFWLALSVCWTVGLVIYVGNPLLTSDAYVLLARWLGLPRLRTQALDAFRAWLFRRPPREPLSSSERRWFIFYGLLCFVYTWGLAVLLLYLLAFQLTDALQGAGVVAFAGLLLFLFHKPLMPYMSGPFRSLMASQASDLTRWLVRLGWLIVVVGVLLIPYPYETGGRFTVLPAVRTEVHSEIEGGRIEQVFVREGDSVAAGQPLGQIDRREYEKNLQMTQAQLDQSEAKLRLLRTRLAMLDQPPNIEEIHALEAEVRRLQTLVNDYRKELELTTLRAPVAGRVTTPQVEQKAGQYLKKGDLFAVIEQAEAIRVEIQVPEEDIPQVRTGAEVKVVSWGYSHETFFGTVKDVAPVAAVAATTQGPKVNAVRVIAEIPNKDLRFKSQITGYAKIKTDKIPVWLVLWRPLIRWFQVQFWYWLP